MYTSSRPGSRPLSYAPTPYSYTPNPSLSARINLDEASFPTLKTSSVKADLASEVKFADTPAERDLVDSLAEIYSIIRTLDGLERAYIKDAITEQEYTEMCTKMLKQYRSILNEESVNKEFKSLEEFIREWDIDCPRAVDRLRSGLPSTIEHPTASTGQSTTHPTHHHLRSSSVQSGPAGSLILVATENFITFLDALRLQYSSKDQLHPLLTEVIQSVNKVTDADFEGRGSIVKWLIRLNQMRASEQLEEEELRECQFDVEGAYNGFKAIIK